MTGIMITSDIPKTVQATTTFTERNFDKLLEVLSDNEAFDCQEAAIEIIKTLLLETEATINVTKEKAVALQHILMEHGVEPDETAVVAQAVGCVFLDEELETVLDWDMKRPDLER